MESAEQQVAHVARHTLHVHEELACTIARAALASVLSSVVVIRL
jgi:hypothetical protein